MREPIRLNEFNRDEWWDVCRRVRPDMTREQFDADWDERQKITREHLHKAELH